MAWEVSFQEEVGIVRVVVRGPAKRDEHIAAREAAARLLREKQCGRLLVDLRELETGGVLSTQGCFEFGANYSTVDGIPIAVRIAHLLPRDTKAAIDVEFTSAVATNRGAAIRNFESPDEARAWLLAP
jgi:hypothetical protein